MMPDDLPESLTLEQLRHIWGEAEAVDWEANYEEDDRVNDARRLEQGK